MSEPSSEDLGRLDLTDLVGQWNGLRRLEREVLGPADRRADPGLTARKFDESQAAGPRTYIAALAHISNALEHIDALQALLIERATPRAPWTLLRSVYESGFWCNWLLEPNDGLTRRRRGLHAEVRGMKERDAFFRTQFQYRPDDLDRVMRDHLKSEQTYRAECAALGLEWSAVTRKIQVFDELQKLAVVRHMSQDMRAATLAMWRSLSGMQHGHAYALMINSDLGPDKTPIAGGFQGVVTIKDDAFVGAASAANLLLIEGMTLYVRRCVSP